MVLTEQEKLLTCLRNKNFERGTTGASTSQLIALDTMSALHKVSYYNDFEWKKDEKVCFYSKTGQKSVENVLKTRIMKKKKV